MDKREKCGSIVMSLFALAALVFGSASAQAQTGDVEAAKKEGKVVVYGAQVPQAMEGLHRGF